MRDASAFLGVWPFASAPAPALGEQGSHGELPLLAAYREYGIDGAAISPTEAVLAPEPMAANRRLFAALDGAGSPFVMRPVPILNPSLPAWRDHLAACLSDGKGLVRAVKLVPSYHDYALDHPTVTALVQVCHERGLSVCVQARMEDERMHHARMKVPAVPPTALAAFARHFPRLPILVCAGYMSELAAYRDCPNVSAELSMVESGHLLRDALRHLGPDRLLLGTHAPIHMIASGVAKLQADELPVASAAQLGQENFDRFFGAQ